MKVGINAQIGERQPMAEFHCQSAGARQDNSQQSLHHPGTHSGYA